ncbi:MAG: 5'-nucleotidase C-terminal domain-containing protein [Elusimicrobiota bacterium]
MNRAGKKNFCLALLALACSACVKNDQAVIFATARTRGRLWAVEKPGEKGPGTGGFAVFKRLYGQEKLPKLAVDAGNWFGATPEGYLTRGHSTIACMNAVPYSLAAAGMEDISLPPKELQKLAAAARFPLIASNLYLKANVKPDFFSSQQVLEAGRHKIGLFSIMLPDPAKPNRAKYFTNYKLEKETYETERAIKNLKAGGAKVIVLLLSVNPKTQAKTEFYRDFLTKVPRVDLVITDDAAVKKPFKVGRSWVVRAGLEMAETARITLALDPSSGKLAGLDWDLLPLDAAKYGQDPEVLKITDAYRAFSTAHFSKRIGTLGAPLPLTEHGVSPVAEFAADCIKTWARANAAIVGVSEPAAGFSSGPVTVADLYNAFPLDSSVVFVKIRGDDLENVLAGLQPGEFSVSGLKLFMKDGALERVETAAGPLTAGKVYHLAVPDSLVSGKETAVLSNAMEFANSRRYLREIIGWCFSSRKPLIRMENGRAGKNATTRTP